MTAPPLAPDIRRHLVGAFVAIGPETAAALLDGLIDPGVVSAAEAAQVFAAAFVDGDSTPGWVQ